MGFVTGIYRHFKGAHYRVLGLARHSETEEPLVVYRALYGHYDLWVRPLDLFASSVTVNGEEIPRFLLVTRDDGLPLNDLESFE